MRKKLVAKLAIRLSNAETKYMQDFDATEKNKVLTEIKKAKLTKEEQVDLDDWCDNLSI